MAKSPKPLPTQQILHTLFDYDPDTGLLTWKRRAGLIGKALAWNVRYPGTIAGRPTNFGYVMIGVFGVDYLAHRLIWVWMYGENPSADIDHINSQRNDNRISNLRAATRSQNHQNRINKPGKILPKGVFCPPRCRRYLAAIGARSKKQELGWFDTPEEAHAAYLAAAKEKYGEFARAA